MLIEQVVGNLLTQDISEPIDWLDLTWSECAQRAVRRPTRGGVMVRVLLPLGQSLRHGDILIRGKSGQSSTIVVNLIPCPVLVITPRDLQVWAQVAYELGSLHVPVQLDGEKLVTLCDGPIEGLLERLEVPFLMQTLRFEPSLTSQGQITVSDAFALNRRSTNGQ